VYYMGIQVPKGEGSVSGISLPHCFGGLNRLFQAKHAKYLNVHIIETIVWIPSKFCIPVKTKYDLWVILKHGTQIQHGGQLNIWGIWFTSGYGMLT